MKRILGSYFVVALQFAAVLGCTSRFNDKEPTAVGDGQGFTIEGRMNANEELNEKLARIEAASNKIRFLITSFKKIQPARVGMDVYTQLDFLLDLNRELRAAPIEKDEGNWVKYSKFELKAAELSAECRTVNARVTTRSAIEGKDLLENGIDGIVYSVKTCHTDGEYVELAAIDFSEANMTFGFKTDNLQELMKDLFMPVLETMTNCDIKSDDKGLISRLSCSGLGFRMSESEMMLIDELTYDSRADIRTLIRGQLYENYVLKNTLEFTIDKDGVPNLVDSK